MKKYGIPSLIAAILGAISYYISLPALNWRSGDFWSFLLFVAIVWIVANRVIVLGINALKVKQWNPKDKKVLDFKKLGRWGIVLVAAFVLVIGVVYVSSSKVFNASKYRAMLPVQNSEFTEDIAEIPYSRIPVVDRDTAERLGSRKIGEVVELVSQFNVSTYYTQINMKEVPTRVSPLEYAGALKWFVNRDEGIPYYVKIDMATQGTELVKLEKGMKYSPSEYFSRDLLRHVRFRYPTKMFEEVSFEIDDSGHPFWVLPYYNYTFGVLGGKDVFGIVLVDAVTGETTDYDVKDVPAWIDRVYSADLVLEQAHNWGTLSNGYWNSVFAQKNVVVTTEGYNYLALDDDVWLYTGITSVVSDESNIGFILINMRTKECKKIDINGAEEYSAMDSAEGMIQEKGYEATFPILMNIESVPSYFVSLKDNAGLVKAYSFVSVEHYQIVGVGDTMESAEAEYLRLLRENNIISGKAEEKPDVETNEVTGEITAVTTAVVDGNSVYYILMNDTVYKAAIKVSDRLPFLTTGDTVTLVVAEDVVKQVK